MIDKTKKFWTGSSAADIDEYLRAYSEVQDLEVHPVVCHTCENDEFQMELDADEGAMRVKCVSCGTEKFLLDSEEIWDEVDPAPRKCALCGSERHNIRIGFIRRNTGEVRWVYSGERCVQCEVLSSCTDFPINYGPTAEMEKNI